MNLLKRKVYPISIILFFSLFFVMACYGSVPNIKNMLINKKIPNTCIKKFIQSGSSNGNMFNMRICLAKADEKHRESKNKSIDSEEDLLAFSGGETGELSEWEYIGSIDQYQIIHTKIDGDSWRNYDIFIFKIIGDEWNVVSSISGPKKSEISGAKVVGNKIYYDQIVTGGVFFSIVQDQLHPSASFESLPQISGELEAVQVETIGSIKYCIQLNNKGKLFDETIISFHSFAGCPPYSGKEYKAEELESLLKELMK